jgi:hypothetical protein
MMNLFKSKEEEKSFVSTYQNPFKSDKCKKITFEIENSWWTNGMTRFQARINFANGDTDGTHKIEAGDFSSLVQKVEQFIKGL